MHFYFLEDVPIFLYLKIGNVKKPKPKLVLDLLDLQNWSHICHCKPIQLKKEYEEKSCYSEIQYLP